MKFLVTDPTGAIQKDITVPDMLHALLNVRDASHQLYGVHPLAGAVRHRSFAVVGGALRLEDGAEDPDGLAGMKLWPIDMAALRAQIGDVPGVVKTS